MFLNGSISVISSINVLCEEIIFYIYIYVYSNCNYYVLEYLGNLYNMSLKRKDTKNTN